MGTPSRQGAPLYALCILQGGVSTCGTAHHGDVKYVHPASFVLGDKSGDELVEGLGTVRHVGKADHGRHEDGGLRGVDVYVAQHFISVCLDRRHRELLSAVIGAQVYGDQLRKLWSPPTPPHPAASRARPR